MIVSRNGLRPAERHQVEEVLEDMDLVAADREPGERKYESRIDDQAGDDEHGLDDAEDAAEDLVGQVPWGTAGCGCRSHWITIIENDDETR